MVVTCQGGVWKVSSGLVLTDMQRNAKNAPLLPSWVSEKAGQGSDTSLGRAFEMLKKGSRFKALDLSTEKPASWGFNMITACWKAFSWLLCFWVPISIGIAQYQIWARWQFFQNCEIDLASKLLRLTPDNTSAISDKQNGSIRIQALYKIALKLLPQKLWHWNSSASPWWLFLPWSLLEPPQDKWAKVQAWRRNRNAFWT